MDLDQYIDIARKIAKNSDLMQKHGSILICDDQIITGYNHFVNSKNTNGLTIHAEEDAINNFIVYCRKKYYDDTYIRRKLKKALLITIRVRNDNIQTSAPCRDCIEYIKTHGIKQIIYSDMGDEDKTILIKKKIRDVENRPSAGYRWKDRMLAAGYQWKDRTLEATKKI